jgi:DNA-binding CsgD family transcriptional regulator
MVEFERGDLEACRGRLDPLVGMARAVGLDQLTALLLIVVAAVETIEGDADRGAELAVEVDDLTHSPFHELQADRHLVLAVALERTGRPGLEQAVRAMDELVRVMPGDHVLGCAEAVRGIRARVGGDHDEALWRLTNAAEAFERAGQWVSAAERWYDAAEQHLALGHPPKRVTARAEALVAEHGLARVARRGQRMASPAETPTCAPGLVEQLTPRELDLLRLLGSGLTNKEIAQRLYLSEHTVRNNLVNVFAKLGIRRRGEAAGIAHRAGLVD